MKAKLLRKVRKLVRLYERNKTYYIENKFIGRVFTIKNYDEAINSYRIETRIAARCLYSRKYKKRLR